jgi:hypothetical protein
MNSHQIRHYEALTRRSVVIQHEDLLKEIELNFSYCCGPKTQT